MQTGNNSKLQKVTKELRPNRLLRRLNTAFARVGPYRFLTRRYFGTNDIATTSRIIEIEGYRHDVVPQPLPIASVRSLLLLAPHQDDEVIGAGGALICARNAGAKISILYVTDGEQYGISSDVRGAESKAVCEQLGAAMLELKLSNIQPAPKKADLEKLNEIIHSVKPDVILAPWLLDGAPKHRLVNHLLWLANQLRPLPKLEVWGYQVQNNLLPNGFIDITEVADEKRELLGYFKSQNADRHWDHVSMGLAAWNSRLLSKSPKPRYSEIFFALPAQELIRNIEKFYFADLETTYLGDASLISHLSSLHQSIVTN